LRHRGSTTTSSAIFIFDLIAGITPFRFVAPIMRVSQTNDPIIVWLVQPQCIRFLDNWRPLEPGAAFGRLEFHSTPRHPLARPTASATATQP